MILVIEKNRPDFHLWPHLILINGWPGSRRTLWVTRLSDWRRRAWPVMSVGKAYGLPALLPFLPLVKVTNTSDFKDDEKPFLMNYFRDDIENTPSLFLCITTRIVSFPLSVLNKWTFTTEGLNFVLASIFSFLMESEGSSIDNIRLVPLIAASYWLIKRLVNIS